MNGPIKVIILDGDDAYRQTVCAWLAGAGGIAIVSQVADAQEALLLAREASPDVILLAVDTTTSAPRIVGQIRAASPGTAVLVLNEVGQERQVLAAFRAGALGHLVKGKAGGPEIAAAIRLVKQGKAVLSPDVAGRILDELIREQQR